MQRLTCLVGLSVLLSCATVPQRNLDRLEASLAIRVAYPETVLLGSALHLSYEVVNVTDEFIDACLSERGGLQVIDYTGSVSSNMVEVDHEHCKTHLRLGPREARVLSTDLTVTEGLMPGRALIALSASAVSREHCSKRYGCYSVTLSAGLGHTILVSSAATK